MSKGKWPWQPSSCRLGARAGIDSNSFTLTDSLANPQCCRFFVIGVYIGSQYRASQTPCQEGVWGWCCCCCSCAVAATCTFGNRTTTTTTTAELQPVCKYLQTPLQTGCDSAYEPLTNGWPNWSPVLQPVCKLTCLRAGLHLQAANTLHGP